MGGLYAHTCTLCGLTAEVSGGPDAGLEELTETVSCERCGRLSDRTTHTGGLDAPVPVPPAACLHCGAPSDALTPWTSGDPCPRCRMPLPAGELTALWD